MTAQFLEVAGSQMVLLTKAEFDRLIEAADDFADVEAAIRSRARREAGEEYLPSQMVDRLLAGQIPLKVWREHRNLSQAQLGELVGCKGSWIAKLEKGRAKGDVAIWRALAKALAIDLDDLFGD